MGLFRRGRRAAGPAETEAETAVGAEGQVDTAADAAGGAGGAAGDQTASDEVADRAQSGPFDESERPGLDGLIDFGAVRLPARAGFKVSAGVAKATGRPVNLTVTKDGSALELQAFAAPKTAGIWDEGLEELAASISKQGGKATPGRGRFGAELTAELPTKTAQGRTGKQVVRFIGVDGPRWLLRGAITGKAARDQAAGAELEDFFASVVVVRGGEARPPREALALKLPAGAARADESAPGGQDKAADKAPDKAPGLLDRGPEITEVR